ncbi:MAG: hypothetical protein KDK63_05675 [Chlamydiia bacterium]|nr:hypothetical protein [Chlamydiia bacterium]
MTFFPEPIRPSEGRQEDELRVNPIEADKHGREEYVLIKQEKQKRDILYGAFLLCCKALIEGLDLKIDADRADPISGTLKEFKTFLSLLKERDHSDDTFFCRQFAACWIRLHQALPTLTRAKHLSSGDHKKVDTLIQEINHYPPNEDHKLGYYLSSMATNDWLPVPFREIVKRLYTDHKVNQIGSFLSQWIELIDDFLQR